MNSVATLLHSLEAHYLSAHLLFFDWLEHLDDHALIRQQVERLEDFRITSTANFTDDLVIILPVQKNSRICIVTVRVIFLLDGDLLDCIRVEPR